MLRSLTRLGVVRGLLGGNRGWLALGAVATGVRAVGKMARKEPKVVFSEELDPGQTLVITHLTRHVK
ncbi:MAG TPA: hypothetical protein VG455_03555 [Acidimicrobiales bacterium]|nr:hypothetical protein [Acidimicrobiales bacterium]